MHEQQNLQSLAKRYIKDVEAKKQELKEAEANLKTVLDALRLLVSEGFQPQENMFVAKDLELESDKYKGKGLRESVLDIIGSHNGAAVTSNIVYTELMAGGYISRSMNKKRDVLVILNRMNKDETIKSIKRGNLKWYTLKKGGNDAG